MTTKNFLPTLLALVIRVMVSGQTSDNHTGYRALPLLGGNKHQSSPNSGIAKKQSIKDKSDALQKDLSANPSSPDKVYPTLIGEEPASSTAKKEKPLTNDNTKAEIDNNTFNYYNNSNCYATMVYAGELIKQADELYLIETAIRSEAKTKHGEAKQKLLAAAKELRNQGQLKQIQASEISGKINLQNFKNGEVVYNGLLFKATNKELLQDAQSLHSDANYSIRLAKELREEAYSLADNSAKLGTMTNAEEKEAIALKTQTAAIHLLKCAIACMDPEFLNDIAMK